MGDDGNWQKTVWIPQINDESINRFERLKQQLNLEKVAADDGAQNLPSHEETTINAKQLEVCNQVFGGILMLNEFLAEQIALALQNARALMPPKLDIDHTAGEIDGAIEGLFAENRPHLLDLRKTDLRKGRELRRFKFENGLTREAVDKGSIVMVIALIMAMFLIESFINGFLFKDVVSAGLVGGMVLAGFISAINIVSGLSAGYIGWRFLGHRKTTIRIIGGVVTFLCHTIALVWNVLIAHFREVAEIYSNSNSFNFDPSVLTHATVAHIRDNGFFGVESVPSWGLLVLGVFIHFIAAKEGWDDIADRYPDHTEHHHRGVVAHEEFQGAMHEMRNKGRSAIEHVEAVFRSAISRTRGCYEATAALLELAVQRQSEVRNSEDKWVSDGNRLLRFYREINVQIRDPGTAPAYFETFPSAADYRRRTFGGGLAPSDDVLAQADAVATSVQEIRSLRDTAKKTLDDAEAALRNIHKSVTAAIKNLDEQIDRESRDLTTKAVREMKKDDDEMDALAAKVPSNEPPRAHEPA